MTIPIVKCKECGYDGEFNSEIFGGLCQNCAEGRKCPKCNSAKISKIPSSTLPIIGNHYAGGKKVPEDMMEKHLSIKHICTNCLYEW